MANSPNAIASHRSAEGGRSPHRLYVFLVTGLTCFLVGLVIWKSSVEGYRAAATIQLHSRSDADRLTIRALRQRILSRENLRNMVAVLYPGITTEAIEQKIRHVTEGVQLEPVETKGDVRRMRLVYVGSTPQDTVAVVDHLSHQLVASPVSAQHHTLPASGLGESQHALQMLRLQEQQANSVVEDLLDEHFEKLNSAIQFVTTRLSSAAPVESLHAPDRLPKKPHHTQADTSRGAKSVENPQWLRLKRNIDGMAAERQRLLLQVTEAHPKVLELDIHLELLNKALQQIPRYVDMDDMDSSVSVGPSSDPPTTEKKSPQDPDSIDKTEVVETLRELTKHHDRYKQHWQELNRARQQLAQQMTTLNELQRTEADWQVAGRIVQAARLEGPVGGTPGSAKLLTLSLLASALGGVMVWSIGGTGSGILTSADQIERFLGIPLTGVISAAGSTHTNDRDVRRRNMAKKVLFACEILLVAMFATALVVCLLDSELANRFVKYPFGTLSELVTKTTT